MRGRLAPPRALSPPVRPAANRPGALKGTAVRTAIPRGRGESDVETKNAGAAADPATAMHEPAVESLGWPGKLLVALYLLAAVFYLGWRPGTLNPEAPFFSGLIYAAELFGFATTLLHLFITQALTVRTAPPVLPAARVDVFIPTLDEPVEVVRRTLLAARNIGYPHETWLLDDGNRPEMAALARDTGARYLARTRGEDAKAGNLNHALRHSSAEFVAVFDADHAPARGFLDRTLGYFRDSRVAFVQTPQDFYNLDSFQHRRDGAGRHIWSEQSLFFRVIQRGKDRCNAAFFCGSCAILRRSALDAVGGFQTGTVTEDLATSVALHQAGFRSVYVDEPLAYGIAPSSAGPFLSQRIRWGQGAMQVVRRQWFFLRGRLSLAQRLNYLASTMTYFDGWQKAVFYLAPVWVLLTGTMPLVTDVPTFLVLFLPYFALTFVVFEEVGRGYGRSVLIEQYNMARFAAFIWATAGLVRRRLPFRVTRKDDSVRPRGESLRVSPQILVAFLNAIALVGGYLLWRNLQHLPWHGLVANMVWATVNLLLAATVVRFTLSRLPRYRRRDYRFPVPLPAQLSIGGARVPVTVDDVAPSGCRIYGRLPDSCGADTRLEGTLQLPDGPLPFSARVASVITGSDAGAAYPRAYGLEFTWDDPLARERLETFLYGSDLQWRLNRLRERARLPWHRDDRPAGTWIDQAAPGHWSVAQLQGTGHGLIRNAPADAEGAHRLLASFNRLDEDADLEVLEHTRSGAHAWRLRPSGVVGTVDTPTGPLYLTRARPC